MNDWIKWCGCKRRILTTDQQNKKKPCALCQQEHPENFRGKLDRVITREQFNG